MIHAWLRIALCGCSHRNTTFPLTSDHGLSRTYVVCLDCGTEFDYDWKAMRKGARVRAHKKAAAASAYRLVSVPATRWLVRFLKNRTTWLHSPNA
jgi:hypothetical protein